MLQLLQQFITVNTETIFINTSEPLSAAASDSQRRVGTTEGVDEVGFYYFTWDSVLRTQVILNSDSKTGLKGFAL